MGFVFGNHSLENISKFRFDCRMELQNICYANHESKGVTMRAYKIRNNFRKGSFFYINKYLADRKHLELWRHCMIFLRVRDINIEVVHIHQAMGSLSKFWSNLQPWLYNKIHEQLKICSNFIHPFSCSFVSKFMSLFSLLLTLHYHDFKTFFHPVYSQ